MDISSIFSILIFLMSAVVHEVSHGLMAEKLGDPTARFAGRLTMNPLKHIDPMGSVFLPLLLVLSGSKFIFGWAKPVPYNPYNLKNKKWGEAMVAFAGPASNIAIAIFFGILFRISVSLNLNIPNSAYEVTLMIIMINIILAVFNLVPVPPLDGSKILFSILPYRYLHIREKLENYGFILVLIFIVFFWSFVSPFVYKAFSVITGI